MNTLYAKSGSCISIMLNMTYPKYKEIIDSAYSNRGGIEGQRDVLKASTAVRIRKRMITDIIKGTVLPPVVLGAVVEEGIFAKLPTFGENELLEWLSDNSDSVSLIDGMQRTTALIEADKESAGALTDYELRVEIWFAKSVNQLIYRMLVLNTGQVPWDIKRQLETVFGSIMKRLKDEVPGIEVYSQDEKRRRVAAAQYQASDILELFLVFGSRKEKIDKKERLSDEFVRLDFIDLTSTGESTELFSEALSMMGALDKSISRVADNSESEKQRFSNGVEVFTGQPARVGFIVSTALAMLGRPGNTQPREQINRKWTKKKESFHNLIDRLNKLSDDELQQFLALPTLNEKLTGKRVPKVGDYERDFFKTAFTTMYEEIAELESFEICWASY